jgi:uncharacterized membrane protein YeaQ/YmgE (transglycosylase-associated protein family)
MLMDLTTESILVVLLVGIVAGWLAGQVVFGTGLGLLADLAAGIAGSFVASWLFPRLGIHFGTGIVWAIIDSAIGAVVLLAAISLIRRVARG